MLLLTFPLLLAIFSLLVTQTAAFQTSTMFARTLPPSRLVSRTAGLAAQRGKAAGAFHLQAANSVHLVLIRHGESQWNEENKFTGWYDCPLR